MQVLSADVDVGNGEPCYPEPTFGAPNSDVRPYARPVTIRTVRDVRTSPIGTTAFELTVRVLTRVKGRHTQLASSIARLARLDR